jgi:8-oxo-dGTP diphosphatase
MGRMREDGQGETVLAVGAVVVDGLRRVLLVRRGRPPAAGTWTLPGGRVEPGEEPEAALVRELREETALETGLVRSIGEVIIDREGTTFRVQEYLVVPIDDTSARAGDDAAEVRWASLEELESLGVLADAIAVVKRGLEVHETIRYTAMNGSAR